MAHLEGKGVDAQGEQIQWMVKKWNTPTALASATGDWID